jgi:hypothetical protein
VASRSHQIRRCRRTAELCEEDVVDEFTGHGREGEWSGRRAGYAEWIALGAVVAGSVGAIVGAARYGRHHQIRSEVDRPDSATLTAPHGDKIPGFRE